MSRKSSLFFLSLTLAVCVTAEVHALDYPTREIEFIVGCGPGSSQDNASRIIP